MDRRQRAVLVIALALALASCAFASYSGSADSPPGFFMGVWHGLLAPWTLILRLFMDIRMYAVPNSGWLYDFGFLIGVAGSLPIGWFCAILAIIGVWIH
jgi:hypothetical protein